MNGDELALFTGQGSGAYGPGENVGEDREVVQRALIDRVPAMIYRCADDPQWTMEFVSAGALELTGYEPEELVGNARRAYADLIVPWHCEAVCHDIQAAIDKHNAWTVSYPIITAGGERKWVWERGVAVLGPTGEVEALEGLIVDMTAEHEADELRDVALDEWRQAFNAMTDSVVLLDESGVVLHANPATAALTGRDMGTIVGSPCHEVFHGLTAPHQDCVRRRTLQSGNVETSLIRHGNAWLRMTFHPIKVPDGRVSGGVHVTRDVTGEERARRKLRESATRREVVSEGLVALLAATSEAGETCSPGHQRRVSELAAAIARTMGLSDDRVEGIRLAALVHDVGMRSVPPDVLAKKGALSAHEFGLVKRHARVGHDILAPIILPWPIADVALQHHERLDGSGYPNGSTADAISVEARIVAVADVMEAMTADRPHRPAPGMDAALDEIAAGAGTRYDLDVCAACLRTARERGSSLRQ